MPKLKAEHYIIILLWILLSLHNLMTTPVMVTMMSNGVAIRFMPLQ